MRNTFAMLSADKASRNEKMFKECSIYIEIENTHIACKLLLCDKVEKSYR